VFKVGKNQNHAKVKLKN